MSKSSRSAPPPPPSIDLSTTIRVQAPRVLRAFFDPEALGAWWQVARSVTSPRPYGPFVVEWTPTEFKDPLLGRLGGILRGTVIQVDPAQGFFVADLYWLPPDSAPIGPMALDVTFTDVVDQDPRGAYVAATLVHLRQTGFEESPRWRRYYEFSAQGWERALTSLKALLEQ